MKTCPMALSNICRRAAFIAMALSAPARASEVGSLSGNPTEVQSIIYRRARAAYETNQFQECKRLLQSSGPRVPVMTLLLAQAECELREYRDCAIHTRESLKWTGHKPRIRIGIEAMLAESIREIGSLILTVNVDNAEVSVDGQLVGETPMVDPTYLDLGKRKVSVAKEGYTTVTRDIESQRGTVLRLNIDLTKPLRTVTGVSATDLVGPKAAVANEVPTPSAAAVREPQVQSVRPNVTILIAGGVGTVGGLMTGLYFNSKAHVEYAASSTLRARVGQSGCATGGGAIPPDCQRLMKHLRDGDQARNYSTLSLAAGATILVGTALYWLWPRHQSSRPDQPPKVTAALAPTTAWLGVSWGF